MSTSIQKDRCQYLKAWFEATGIIAFCGFKRGKNVYRNTENENVLLYIFTMYALHILSVLVILSTKNILSPHSHSPPLSSFFFILSAIWFKSPSGLASTLYYTKMACFNGQITSKLYTKNFIDPVHSMAGLEKGNVILKGEKKSKTLGDL